MAEVVGLAASVIAIIDLSAKVAVLCLDYSTAVGNARADITRLRSRLYDLGTTLQGVQHLLDDPSSQALATSRRLVDSVDGCTSELVQLQARLDPGKARKAMRRFGLRALKWPFDSKELSDIVSNLERYERTITLGLQIDQTTLLLDIRQRIEGVSLQPKEDASIARKPYFSLPFERDPDFVDRPDIMVWIKEQYAGPVGRMALVGMGGFGKSQVAIQFAHHIRDTSPQTSVFWVHASSKPRFEEAYRSIADNLRLPRRNDPSVDVLGLVRDWLQREEAGPWLMVLDNVDDVNLFYPSSSPGRDGAVCHPADENPAALSVPRPLAVFLPKCRNGIILVTSRSMDAAEKLTGSHKAVYGISAMDDAQALQLFRNKLQGDSDKTAAADLLRALDYIPLAITQAAAYINRRAPRISVKTYLDAFRESDKKKGSLLNSDAGDLRRDETVSNSVVTTWQVTLEQIRRERPSAANLLSLMSFFNPQGIPEFVLHHYKGDLTENADGVKDDEDNDEFEDDLDVLRGYSLVCIPLCSFAHELGCLWLTMQNDGDRYFYGLCQDISHLVHSRPGPPARCYFLTLSRY
ncbi:P-loop containing nucleoside triphosphate hydrolase protein [Ilyonectria destructans]|nr:P-loop containing nucleoside triphosphate hydrolase protein [Ilyonectria destructans]